MEDNIHISNGRSNSVPDAVHPRFRVSPKLTMNGFRIALVQMSVIADKAKNVANAVKHIFDAKSNGAHLVALPECFNSLYGTKYFKEYAEVIPSGPTCQALSKAARDAEVYVVGGSIPEEENGKLYNTCMVWDSTGQLIAKHRKVHLFDIDIPGKITFKESDVLSPGNSFNTFNMNGVKIGLGICYDVRFSEMAKIYANEGCSLLLYPGAFNMTTGPKHWELLGRSRAVDNQLWVAFVSPARDEKGDYVAWGHSSVFNPWGYVTKTTGSAEDVIFEDIDLTVIDEVRGQIPVTSQRRLDLYNTFNMVK